jgi:CRISPR system Cascade subunit CasC
LSPQFAELLGSIRTRQLPKKIAEATGGDEQVQRRAEEIMKLIGFLPKKSKKDTEDNEDQSEEKSKATVFVSKKILGDMARLVQSMKKGQEEAVAREFAELITKHVSVPDMALAGRMLEPHESAKAIWKGLEYDRNVEASLQVAHAISTHEARPEVDYFTTADDVKGADTGAAYVDETMFASACFYKYFSIHWEGLIKNLKGQEELAAHTVGAFLRGAALTTPTGKQNSFAAQNRPDGILVEFKNSPVSYANAFVRPVQAGERDLVEQSIVELAKYVAQQDQGYGAPAARLWFSPGGRYPLTDHEGKNDNPLGSQCSKSLEELVKATVAQLDLDWDEVRKVKL